RERQPENGVARLRQSHEHALVGLAPGVRLHVGECATEKPLGPVDGELFGDVDKLASAIVATPWIAFRVLVREHRSGSLEHRPRDDVLRGDQLDLVLLAFQLVRDGAEELGITLGKGLGEKAWRGIWSAGTGGAHSHALSREDGVAFAERFWLGPERHNTSVSRPTTARAGLGRDGAGHLSLR